MGMINAVVANWGRSQGSLDMESEIERGFDSLAAGIFCSDWCPMTAGWCR